LSDIFNWDVSQVTNMKDVFKDCSNIESMPDLKNYGETLKYEITWFDITPKAECIKNIRQYKTEEVE
jgi:hypothetical protein